MSQFPWLSIPVEFQATREQSAITSHVDLGLFLNIMLSFFPSCRVMYHGLLVYREKGHLVDSKMRTQKDWQKGEERQGRRARVCKRLCFWRDQTSLRKLSRPLVCGKRETWHGCPYRSLSAKTVSGLELTIHDTFYSGCRFMSIV